MGIPAVKSEENSVRIETQSDYTIDLMLTFAYSGQFTHWIVV